MSDENKFILALIISRAQDWCNHQLFPNKHSAPYISDSLWDMAVKFKIAMRNEGGYEFKGDFINRLAKAGGELQFWANNVHTDYCKATRTKHAPPVAPLFRLAA